MCAPIVVEIGALVLGQVTRLVEIKQGARHAQP